MGDEPMGGSGLGAVAGGSGNERGSLPGSPIADPARPGWIGPTSEPVVPFSYLRAPSENLGRHIAVLTHAIEHEVVPRLLLARRNGVSPVPPCARADVAELVRLLLLEDEAAGAAYVDRLCDAGLPLERMFLELLSPAARRLGEMWEEDTCTFTDVTLALGRLHEILRAHGDEFLRDAVLQGPNAAGQPRRILLVPLPGEQHTFGLAMVSEFFSRAGWDVQDATPADARQLAAIVREEWFAVVGLSIGGRDRLQDVARLIRTIRRASCNQSVGVMVGGPAFVSHPELAARLGADATATDAKQAVAQAESLFGLMLAQS